MITERDEHLHEPGIEMPERWQENMMVYGWDLDANVGFFFHVQRMPHAGTSELKIVVCDTTTGVSGSEVIPLPDGVMYEGLVMVEPFKRATLRYAGTGVVMDSPTALPALSYAGSVPYSIDVTLHGHSGPADWYEGLSLMASTESMHYQVAGSFEGTLAFAEESVSATGLFWRDHTWGNRNYVPEEQKVSDGKGGLRSSWFTPVVFDEGHTFFNGLWISTTDGREQAFCTLSEGEHTRLFHAFSAEVLEGEPKICEYDAVRLTCDEAEADCRLDVIRHLPMYLPHHGPDANLSEAFGRATWGSRTGWGSAELMETLPDWKSRPLFAEQLAAV